jgi:Cu/Ag efflux pump CusA
MVGLVVRASLQFRYLVVMVGAVLLAVGGHLLSRTPVDILPEFNPPIVEIQTEALGLSADEVENLVTINLEELFASTSWLQTIISKSVPSLSSILMVFEPGTDLMRARQMVQERMTLAYALPNVSKPPVMLQPLSSASRATIIGLTSEKMSLIDLSVLARWTFTPKLLAVPGVANVTIWGQRARQLQVQVDPQKLRAQGVTLSQVVNSAGNSLWISPLSFIEASTSGTGGWIDTPNQRLGIQHVQPITKPADLAKVAVEGTNLQLGEVAKVVEEHPPLIGDAVVRSGPGLLLVVEKFPQASTTEVVRGVDRALEELRQGMPGIEIDNTLFRATSFINSSVANLRTALVAGIVLLMVLLLVAFRSWRVAAIALVGIGLSLITALMVQHLYGAALNTMVLAGFAIALAPLIDDAITNVAALQRSRDRNETEPGRSPAAMSMVDAWVEIRRPALYATLIAILVIGPLFLLKGPSGAFFGPMAASFVLALIASAAMAVTFFPALGYIVLSRGSCGKIDWATRRYKAILSRVMEFPRFTYLAVAAFAIVTLGMISVASWALLPSFKERDVQISWEGAPGTSQPEMRRIILQVSRELSGLPGIRSVAGQIGRAITGDQVVGIESGQLWVGIDESADYDETVAAIRTAVQGFPGIHHAVESYLNHKVSHLLQEPARPIVVRIEGAERSVLQQQAERVAKVLLEFDGVTDIQIDSPVETPEVKIEVDLAAAGRSGLKPGDVRRAAATVFAGLEVGNLFEQQKVFDVVVQGSAESRRSLTDLRNLLIDTPDGGQVRLADVADVRIEPTPRVIEREGASRHVDITARAPGRRLHSMLEQIEAKLAKMQFPLEYHTELLDDYEKWQNANWRLAFTGVASAVLIFFLLQAFLQSWSLAFALMLAFAAALSGGLLLTMVTSGNLLLGSLAGLLAIVAVTARHALLLAGRYQALRRDDQVTSSATMLECAGQRMTPVVVSLLAITAAFFPVVIVGNRAGLEILQPMAIALLGGAVTASLVTLIALPVLYSFLLGPRVERLP